MSKRNSIRYLTSEQKKQLLKKLSDSKSAWRDYFMFDLMLNTGLRLAETVGLNIGDVFNGYTAKKTIEVTGKGDRTRQIPLNREIQGHIEDYIKTYKRHESGIPTASPLFISRVGKRITSRGVQLNFDKWITESGIEGKYSPHALRHTVGTLLMQRTGNIRKVQEFLGHKFVSTTQIYTGITKEDLVECSELLTV